MKLVFYCVAFAGARWIRKHSWGRSRIFIIDCGRTAGKAPATNRHSLEPPTFAPNLTRYQAN